MFEYNVPGNEDNVSPQVKAAWNKVLQDAYRLRKASSETNYFTLDPTGLASSFSVSWEAHPQEAVSCKGKERAKQLADWGLKGHRLHTDYCEYRIICENGRPKRVEVTTELREYWVTVAKHDPDQLKAMVAQILPDDEKDELLSWQNLYGQNEPPSSEEARELQFCIYMAGNGGNPRLKYLGVPDHPISELHKRHILFMHHPGNGLDNLFYLIMASAQRYVQNNGGPRASNSQIFEWLCRPELRHRNSNVSTFQLLGGAAFGGQRIAFDDQSPPGLYIENALTPHSRELFRQNFSYNGNNGNDDLADWIQWGRDYQRLEVGPTQAGVYLDQIIADDAPLTGGYQLLEKLRVSLSVRTGDGAGQIEASSIDISQNEDRRGCEGPDPCEKIENLSQLAGSDPSPCDS